VTHTMITSPAVRQLTAVDLLTRLISRDGGQQFAAASARHEPTSQPAHPHDGLLPRCLLTASVQDRWCDVRPAASRMAGSRSLDPSAAPRTKIS
jgi:hypothetical protein